ncbi:MAG: hypothetical protein QM753_19450 [Thermomicrobiales bacterium]
MTQNTPSLTPTPEEAAAIVRDHQAQQDTTPAATSHEPHEGHGGHGDGIHMPSPSIWPIVSAFGITMISFGILTGWPYSAFGGVVLAISLWKWAGEMRRDAA